MKLPIPNDWQGEDWSCIEVQWPDSPQWIGILSGLLTSALRGRLWDEQTGLITDAQAVGELIYNANFPFITCGDRECTPPSPEIVYRIMSTSDESENEMVPLCGYNPKAFKIQNGILYVRDFCGDWVAVGPVGSVQAPTEPIIPVIPDVDTGETPIEPCAMAEAIASLVVALAGFIWDSSDNTLPIFMPGKSQNYVNLDLNNLEVINATTQSLIMKGSVIISGTLIDLERSDVIPTDLYDTLACALLAQFTAQGTFDASLLYSAIRNTILARFPTTESGNNIFIQNYYEHIRAAIGQSNFEDTAKSAMYNAPIGDCLCAENQPLAPVTGGWYLSELHTVSTTITDVASAGNVSVCDEALHHVYGAFQWVIFSYQTGAVLRWFIYGNTGGCTNDVNLTWHASTAVYGGQNMHCQMDDSPMTALYNALEASAYATGKNKMTDVLGPRSTTINSPVASQGQIMQSSFGGHMDTGATATATFYWRYIHNNTDNSH